MALESEVRFHLVGRGGIPGVHHCRWAMRDHCIEVRHREKPGPAGFFTGQKSACLEEPKIACARLAGLSISFEIESHAHAFVQLLNSASFCH